MTNKGKIMAAVGISLASAVIITVSSLAIFSDTENNQAQAKAGTLDISLSDAVLTNNMNVNPGDHDPRTPEKYKPSPNSPLYDPENPDKEIEISTTEHILSYNISNIGTKSAKTRQTIIISAKDSNGKVIDPSVFSLFEDKNGNGRADEGEELSVKSYIYTGSEKSEPATEESFKAPKDNCNSVVFQFTGDTFDGINSNNKEDGETEDGTTVKYNAENNSCSATYSYMFGMSRDAGNDYQMADITLEIVVEAIQYRNTEESDWNIVASEKITSTVSGVSLDVVPDKNQ